MKTWIVIVSIVFLSACASTGSEVKLPDEKTEANKAARINVQLASGYMQRGDYEVALEKLQKALREDPKYATAHTVTGVLYSRIGAHDKAGHHYRRAAELSPEDGGILNNYGQYLCMKGKFEEAYPYFERAVEQPFYSTPELALTNAGRCATVEKDYAKAETYLRLALKRARGYPPTLMAMATLMAAQQENLKARAFLQRYHSTSQVSDSSLFLGYDIERRLGDKEASEEYRQKLIQQFPESPFTKRLL